MNENERSLKKDENERESIELKFKELMKIPLEDLIRAKIKE